MGRDDRDKNNPWGKPANGGGEDRGPWGAKGGSKNSGNGGGYKGGSSPDMDEMLRKAQENFRNVMPSNFSGAPIIGLGLLLLIALWFASGFYVVNPGEQAVIQRFGKWTRTQADPGLGYHLPTPIETTTIVNVEEIRKMNVGFTEGFSRNGAVGRQDVPEESLMLTADRNIIDLDMVLQWNIKSAEDYLFEIRDQERIIKSIAESAIREVVGQTAMFPIITTGRAAVAEAAKTIIQTNLDEYKSGVIVTQVLIERAEVHPDVQSSFQDVQSAKQDAEDTQNQAQAYREGILPRARGEAIKLLQEAQAYKQSTIARSNGDAERFNSVYAAYLNGKDVTKERIYIETMENVMGNAQKIIMDNNNGQGVVPYLPLNQLKPAAAQKN